MTKTYIITPDKVVDNLTSTDTDKPLSAKQGKELKTLIDAVPSLPTGTLEGQGVVYSDGQWVTSEGYAKFKSTLLIENLDICGPSYGELGWVSLPGVTASTISQVDRLYLETTGMYTGTYIYDKQVVAGTGYFYFGATVDYGGNPILTASDPICLRINYDGTAAELALVTTIPSGSLIANVYSYNESTKFEPELINVEKLVYGGLLDDSNLVNAVNAKVSKHQDSSDVGKLLYITESATFGGEVSTIDIDTAPTSGSNIPISSGAMFTALGNKASTTHASTHEAGGTDAITIAESQVTNLTTDLAAKALASDLTAHTGNTSNPHSVTATQIGAATTGALGCVKVGTGLYVAADGTISDAVYANTHDELKALLGATQPVVIKLGADITATNMITIPAGVTNVLDLNGHNITSSGTRFMWLTNNGNFTLKGDGVISGFSYSTTSLIGVGCVYNGGTFTMSGGSITNCSFSNSSGGVGVGCVYNGGTFTMSGGSITNCSCSNSSGGIGVGGVYNMYTFTMSGGSITNCSGSSNGAGGVYNMYTFTMSGGSITNCSGSSNGAGGVYNGGTFTMSDNAIIENNYNSDYSAFSNVLNQDVTKFTLSNILFGSVKITYPTPAAGGRAGKCTAGAKLAAHITNDAGTLKAVVDSTDNTKLVWAAV